eukprot:1024688-Pelagomonas_calceolata.AAC.4
MSAMLLLSRLPAYVLRLLCTGSLHLCYTFSAQEHMPQTHRTHASYRTGPEMHRGCMPHARRKDAQDVAPGKHEHAPNVASRRSCRTLIVWAGDHGSQVLHPQPVTRLRGMEVESTQPVQCKR